MKKFIVYLLIIVLAVSLGFGVFYLVRDDEVISISSASIYKDAGEPFQIDVNHQNKKSYTTITVSTSNANVVSYNKETNTFNAEKGGVARINFRTSNAKYRNLWCDVIVGDGTMESPYYISTPEQLASIGMGLEIEDSNGVYQGSTTYDEKYAKYSSDKCYKLVNDIDLKDINEGFWIPLREFTGRFDGNGFTIYNMNINRDAYTAQFADTTGYDPNLFVKNNVGMFQKIGATGSVYNFKLSNVYAEGIYDNFGVITAENRGVIERIEVKDAYLSVESKVLGGLVANNISDVEEGESDSYVRRIARIDRCSINMTTGKKIVEDNEYIKGINGTVGGLVGINQGGIIVYSYSKGEVAFGSDANEAIIYGGLVGKNTYSTFTKFGGELKYTSKYQGGNIKDCYSDLKTNFDTNSTNSNSRFAGAIAINQDYSEKTYPEKSNEEVVQNYLVGIYYNKDNLNAPQDGITKGYIGIAQFEYNNGKKISFVDEKTIVYGLTEEEMKVGDNFVSHKTYELEFDEEGNSKGLVETDITWLFGSVWALDNDNNDGKPYLNYQLIYIPNDLITAGTPVIKNGNIYMFERAEVETSPKITSGTNGIISLQEGQTYNIKVTPAGIKFNWKSSDESVVSVDGNGKIYAMKEGRATIIVSNNSGISDSVTVIVTSAPYSITGLPKEINLKEGEQYKLNPTITPNNATATFKSYNQDIAVVSADGTITAVSEGSAYVYVFAGDSAEKVKVNVIKDTSTKVVTINFKDNSTVVGNGTTVDKEYANSTISGQVTVTSVMYQGSNVKSDVNITFTSSNTNILTIDNTGKYYINGAGKAYITIKAEGNYYLGTAGFTINSCKTYSITGLPEEVNLKEGEQYALNPTITPDYTTATYKSYNTAVATVDSNGVITAVSEGSAEIYVFVGNISEKVKVNVTKDTSTKVVTINFKDNSTSLNNGTTVDKEYANSTISGQVTVASVMYQGSNVKSNVNITFASSNTSVLTIDSTGKYYINGVGKAYITIKAEGNYYLGTAGFTINSYKKVVDTPVTPEEPDEPVVKIDNIYFNVTNYNLYVGQSFTLITKGTAKYPIYSSEDSSIATVSSAGVVNAKKKGTTEISAYIINDNGQYSYAYCQVVVMEKAQKTITISPTSSTVNVGETVELIATLKNGDASDKITWSMSDSNSIASKVSESGNTFKVKMNKAGSITVTAKCGTVSATATILANDPNAYSKYIYNATQLNAVRYHLSKDFIIAANIDLTGWNWIPIGDISSPFTGTITNNGSYTISNMTVGSGYTYAGLFGNTDGANISKININNASVTGTYVGAVAGCATSTAFSKCSVSNSELTGITATGGIAGQVSSKSTFDNCKVSGSTEISTISGGHNKTKFAGGIVGNANNSSVSNCQVSIQGSISLGSSTYGYAGGIAGYITGAISKVSVQKVSITANDSDDDYAGGIVGYTTKNITSGVVKNTSISGYYAGGIGGALNVSKKITIDFSDFKKGYRKEDVSYSNYTTNVQQVAVKENVNVKGLAVGGLFGTIKSGVVKNCYSRAYLQGLNKNAIKGGFASTIEGSGMTNAGGTGNVGIVEDCYNACTFNSTGANWAVTSTYVHNYKDSKATDSRPAGFCFNYLFDSDVGGGKYFYSGNIFSKDLQNAKKSTKEMKTASTYTNKGFSTSVWNITSDYATLKIESSL